MVTIIYYIIKWTVNKTNNYIKNDSQWKKVFKKYFAEKK